MIVGALVGWVIFNTFSDVATAIQLGNRSNLARPYAFAALCALIGAAVGVNL